MCVINVNTTGKLIYIINNINLDTRFIKSIIKITIINLFMIFLIISLSKNSQFLLFFGLSPMFAKNNFSKELSDILRNVVFAYVAYQELQK